MAANTPLTRAQTIVRVCLLLTTAVIIAGAGLQIVQGASDGDVTADHIHRFMAGVYIGWAPLFFWAAGTIRSQGVLVYFLAVPIFLGALGRLLSIALNGLPDRPAEFLSFGALELILAFVIVWAHSTALRSRRVPAVA
ncbi:DUF4345 domain-containing protein [Streptomyces sp. NPDC050625]|uniref:DUF4345 domain-containing protein n=1 Tax=Streptomyces sp. NPDC050625 TaxID=3154629 RepID=UPI00342A96B4